MSHLVGYYIPSGGVLGGSVPLSQFSTNGYCSIQTFGPRPYPMQGFSFAQTNQGRQTVRQQVNTINTVTYSASMTPDLSQGNVFVISANNGTAFTINAPTNPIAGQVWSLTIRNTSGGALGVATFNAVFKLATWTQPANANSRTITFYFDGTNHIERSRTPADVPN